VTLGPPVPKATLGRVLAVLIGAIRDLPADGVGGWIDRPWRTAIFKQPVSHPVWFGALGPAGDDHADPARHGGEEKAVLVYSQSTYDALRAEGFSGAQAGAFGENLLVAGFDEAGVCIGDRMEIGSAELRVAQPRQPAWKIARRWHDTRLPKRLAAEGRTGWYCRVIRPGEITAGSAVALLERPHPELSVLHAVEVLYARPRDPDAAAALASCPWLASSWRAKLRVRYGSSLSRR